MKKDSKFLVFCLLIIASSATMVSTSTHAQTTVRDTLRWNLMTPTRYQSRLDGRWLLTQTGSTDQVATQVPGVLSGLGKARLEREFYLDKSFKNKAIFLSAAGINDICTIVVNNTFIGGHSGGYTSFNVALKANTLEFGAANKLAVEIDDTENAGQVLPYKQRLFPWPQPDGILRDIYLLALPAVAIEDIALATDLAPDFKTAAIKIAVSVRAYNEFADSLLASGPLQVFAKIKEANNPNPLATSNRMAIILEGAIGKVDGLTMQINDPALWSPGAPHLYTLEVYLLSANSTIDTDSYTIGLRQVGISGRKFTLNGKPWQIKGVDWIDDLAGLSGDSLARAIDRVIDQAKTLGVNTIRPVGHPAHPLFVKRCSEEGIFLLEEMPLFYANKNQLRSDQIVDAALQTLEEMINRDKTQPAVLAWGLGGNIEDTAPESGKSMAHLVARARGLDARPLYYVTRSRGQNYAASSLDFILFDNFGEDKLAFDPNWFPGKPVLPILGYFVEPKKVSRQFTDLARRKIEADEIQAQRLEHMLVYLNKDWPDYTGSFIHALADWRAAWPLLILGPDGDSYKYPAGLIRTDNTYRIGYRMVAANNLGDRKPPISPNDERPQHPIYFPVAGLSAVLVLLFYLNRDKRLRGHLRRVFVHPHGFYMDLYENRKVPLFLTALLAVLQGVIWGVIISGATYAFRSNLLFDEILTFVIPSANIKTVLIKLIWHPGIMISAVAIFYVVIMLANAIFFRLLAFFFGVYLPLIQFVTFVFWTATCYLPLGIIAPIFYRLVLQQNFLLSGLGILSIFFLWHLLRLFRGMRVLYMLTTGRGIVVFVSVLALFVVTLGFSYGQTHAIIDYFSYYKALLR